MCGRDEPCSAEADCNMLTGIHDLSAADVRENVHEFWTQVAYNHSKYWMCTGYGSAVKVSTRNQKI